jgi:hypothetical protein
MRRLLTGYAINFNRRHKRVGYLFQNRYKSIVCEADAYFRGLVRYIHLNPMRAQRVESLRMLACYQWCGHATVLGRNPRPWQDRRAVLAWFGDSERRAINRYRDFVREGVPVGRRPDLVGGGLVRSAGGWAEVRARHRHNEPLTGDSRILGDREFVAQLLRDAEAQQAAALRRSMTPEEIGAAIHRACATNHVAVEEFQKGGRRGPLSTIRAEIARMLVTVHGLSLAQTARHLGVSTTAVSKILRKAEREV